MTVQQKSLPILLGLCVILLAILFTQSRSYAVSHPMVSCSMESSDGYYHEHTNWKCIRSEDNKVYTDTYVFDGKVGYLTEIKS